MLVKMFVDLKRRPEMIIITIAGNQWIVYAHTDCKLRSSNRAVFRR